jgi:hypothetical protein
MILIPVNKNEGIVSVHIEIHGSSTWDYNYDEDQSYHNDSILKNPKVHILGNPYDLIKKKHKWDFIIINPSDQKIKIDIKMKWKQIQKNTTVEISKWSIKNFEIPANTPKPFSDEGYIVKN